MKRGCEEMDFHFFTAPFVISSLIVDHGTDILIQFDFQGDDFLMGIDMQLIGEGCIVYGIVFIKGLRYGIAYPVPAHISLISQDDGGGDGIYRSSAGFLDFCKIFV